MSLAVRFAGSSHATATEEDGIDEFLSSQGFEFIEGDRETHPTHDGDRDVEDADTGTFWQSQI